MEQQENTQQPTLEQQLREAEERGYRRGLNEQIESKMRESAVWEGPEGSPADPPPGFQILDTRRQSIWDS